MSPDTSYRDGQSWPRHWCCSRPQSRARAGHAPVRMPDLVGRSRLAVYRTMRHDGLYFMTRGPGSANDHWAVVAAQSPRPGAVIAWHGEAVLTVSTVAPHAARAVPRLIGLSRAGVYAAMRRAQLFFRTVGPGSSSGRWVVALSQSPAAGTKVAWHGEVTVPRGDDPPGRANDRSQTTTTPVAATGVVVNGDELQSRRRDLVQLHPRATARRGTCPRARASPCATSPRDDRSPASSLIARRTSPITSSISTKHSSANWNRCRRA